MVNEIIVAFLGTLPLGPYPESKPFTPSPAVWRRLQGNASGPTDHPGSPDGGSSAPPGRTDLADDGDSREVNGAVARDFGVLDE